MSVERPRLVALGWHAPGTGFDRVLEAILSRLADRWEVHLAGIGHQGEELERRGYRVHPTNRRGGGDSLGAYAARDLLAALRPSAVLVLHDIWHMGRYELLLRTEGWPTRRAAYVPLDGEIVDPSVAAGLLRFDLVVAYCPWAREQIAGAWHRLGAATDWPELIDIPHGLDTEAFRPLSPDRVAIKRQVFPGLENPERSFVVLNASRPAQRKRIDLTLAAFARFARGKPPGVRLCLHWAVFTDHEIGEAIRLAGELGIADRLLLNPLTPKGGALTDEQLNRLYNACDVGLNTSMGEGWGLVSFEHAATGAPQVVPRHSACAGLWEGAAMLVEPVRRGVPPFSRLEMAEVDAVGVSAALEALHADGELRGRIGDLGRRRAADPSLSWGRVADQWHRALSRAVPPPRSGSPAPTGLSAS